MSEKHGNKARYDREQKKKNLRRKRTREVSRKLLRENKTAPATGAESEQRENSIA